MVSREYGRIRRGFLLKILWNANEFTCFLTTAFKVLAPGGSPVFHKISDMSPILHNSPSNVLPKVVTVGLNLRNTFPRFNLTVVMLLLTTQLLIKLINSDIDKPGIYMGFSLFGQPSKGVKFALATKCHLSSDLEGIFHHNFFCRTTILCVRKVSFGFSPIGSLVFSPGRGKKKGFFPDVVPPGASTLRMWATIIVSDDYAVTVLPSYQHYNRPRHSDLQAFGDYSSKSIV